VPGIKNQAPFGLTGIVAVALVTAPLQEWLDLFLKKLDVLNAG
jgi:hypothetical protein